MASEPKAVTWGCEDEACGYRCDPSTLPTLKTVCPLCARRWVANPPPRKGLYVEVPAWAWGHFFDEPPEGSWEFWSFGKRKPACEPGDPLLFRYQGTVVARAVVAMVEEPGKSQCDATGKFGAGFKVYWRPETFVDLRKR